MGWGSFYLHCYYYCYYYYYYYSGTLPGCSLFGRHVVFPCMLLQQLMHGPELSTNIPKLVGHVPPACIVIPLLGAGQHAPGDVVLEFCLLFRGHLLHGCQLQVLDV